MSIAVAATRRWTKTVTTETTEPDELNYVTRVDVNIAILREMSKLKFKERLPRIMAGVARQLVDAGVDFSSAVVPENLTITDEEWDAIYEDFNCT